MSRPDLAPTDRALLLSANEDAASFFRHRLLADGGSGPRRYLMERGFDELLDDTPWTVGFAPRGWSALTDHMLGLGYSEDILERSGLSTRSRRDNVIDRFRNRVTFGVRNREGELLAFVARAAPGAGDRTPKYLNTPRTELYDKGAELFGLHEDRWALDATASVVLVEGPLDAIALDLATSRIQGAAHYTPLALCGTSVSTRQAELLTPGVIARPICVEMDCDTAGDAAAERALAILAPQTRNVTGATMPHGHDVAEAFLRSGAYALVERLDSRQLLVDHLIDRRLASWPNVHDSAERELCCLREVAKIVAMAPPHDMARIVTQLASQLKLSHDTVTREVIQQIDHHKRVRPVTAVPAGSASRRCCLP